LTERLKRWLEKWSSLLLRLTLLAFGFASSYRLMYEIVKGKLYPWGALLSDARRGARTADRSGGLERLVPPKKVAPIEISLPEVRTVADIPKILAAVSAKLGAGGITPSQARTVIDLAEAFRNALEVADLEPRVLALEQRFKIV
jgi:hypothetical protein